MLQCQATLHVIGRTRNCLGDVHFRAEIDDLEAIVGCQGLVALLPAALALTERQPKTGVMLDERPHRGMQCRHRDHRHRFQQDRLIPVMRLLEILPEKPPLNRRQLKGDRVRLGLLCRCGMRLS